jgi:hypothetical protein
MKNRKKDSKAPGREGAPAPKGFYPFFDEKFLKQGYSHTET